MSSSPVRDIFHFLSIEEENILKSNINLAKYFVLITELDELYKSCLTLESINKKEHKIPCFLYLIIHSEYYIAMANFLRLHQSKSFCSLRAALDCAFTAYYLLKHPDKRDVYLSKIKTENNEADEKEWTRIFQNIKMTIKNDIDSYPHAKILPEIHEFCSIHSHSDALGIMHRYNIDKEKLMLEAQYFDYEEKVEDYNRWLACLLFSFFRIFLIFWHEIFRPKAGSKLTELEQKIKEHDSKIRLFKENFPLRDKIEE